MKKPLLNRLTKEELSLVREWRNSDHIKKFALNQKEITKEQQSAWFEKIQQSEDEYFIISIDEKKCGLIWFNKIEQKILTGFYIYNEELQNSLTPFNIVTTFHEYLFLKKKFNKIYCKIMPDNKRAIRFNLALGYKVVEEKSEYSLYELGYENYKKSDKKIRKLLK
ncbi:MAG: GNAT family N-acetyltransferase [Helicobacteraceae bacterium]|nr:GNAT family N-acetyltransferase [Helicobacteraceae bacterium]